MPQASIFTTHLFERGLSTLNSGPAVWLGVEPSRGDNSVEVLVVLDLLNANYSHVKDSLASSEVAWAHLRAISIFPPSEEPSRKDVLTIHVRGGDVFGGRRAVSYGQPPLAYYQLVIDSEPWSAVHLIHEDEANPVLPGIVEHCRMRKIFLTQSSHDDAHDIALLLEAQVIVAGRGTFIPAVVGMSRSCSRVYFFEDKFALTPPKQGVTQIRVVDQLGMYKQKVLSRNWMNSPQQRELMISYPISALSFEKPQRTTS